MLLAAATGVFPLPLAFHLNKRSQRPEDDFAPTVSARAQVLFAVSLLTMNTQRWRSAGLFATFMDESNLRSNTSSPEVCRAAKSLKTSSSKESRDTHNS